MKKAVLVAALSMLVTGCATVKNQPLDAKASESLKDQSLTYTTRDKPSFAAMTAGKAAFAILGAAAMISEGNGIIADNQVDDPATAISLGLMKALESSHGTKSAGTATKVEGDDLDKIAASAKEAQFVVDVQTLNWSFVYFPTDWTHYRVIYSAKARLIDTKARSVVAEGACSRVPENSANAPTYEDLVGNGAAGLKKELNLAVGECIQALKTAMLKL
jgi:hypothetical protein